MLATTLPGMLLPGFLLGLLHALDVDHVAAVSSLAARQSGWRGCTAYALRWATGHAAVLLSAALAVTALGTHLPEAAGHLAERAVGVVLVLTGASLLLAGRADRAPGSASPPHFAWLPGSHSGPHTACAAAAPHHVHTPVLVGMVHGMAGSAAALALIPVALQEPGAALTYIGVFSLGVAVAMFSVAVLLGHAQRALAQRHARLIEGYRAALAGATLALGLYWLIVT